MMEVSVSRTLLCYNIAFLLINVLLNTVFTEKNKTSSEKQKKEKPEKQNYLQSSKNTLASLHENFIQKILPIFLEQHHYRPIRPLVKPYEPEYQYVFTNADSLVECPIILSLKKELTEVNKMKRSTIKTRTVPSPR